MLLLFFALIAGSLSSFQSSAFAGAENSASTDRFTLKHLAVGGGLWLQSRKDLENHIPSFVIPEFVLYGYHPLGWKSRFESGLWLRSGFRVNYQWQQPDMPQAIQIREYDLRLIPEVSLFYNQSFLIPSLALGMGMNYRVQSWVLQSQWIQNAGEDFSKKSFLWFLHVQVGLGIPMHQGFFVLEPFLRYHHYFPEDHRYGLWCSGIEGTFLLF